MMQNIMLSPRVFGEPTLDTRGGIMHEVWAGLTKDQTVTVARDAYRDGK